MIPLSPLSPRTDAPAAEQPLELLLACHDKVRRFSALVERLAGHVQQHGADAEAVQAAQSILRYFELALPNHHADEEEDVFPALRALHEADLVPALNELLREHEHLDALWGELQPWLKHITQGVLEATPAVAAEFARAYPAHIEREEREVFPGIARLPALVVAAIAQRMRARRGG